jgi:hypothetical protein
LRIKPDHAAAKSNLKFAEDERFKHSRSQGR